MIRKLIFLFFVNFNVFAFDIDESMTGSWFDKNNSGQGINIEILTGKRMVVYWYTYDNNGQPLWLTGVGGYSGNAANIEISQFSGSKFGIDHNVSLVSNKIFGSLKVIFDSCDTGSMTYDSIQGFGNGTINLNRLTSVPGLPCTTPTTPFSQNSVVSNDYEINPRACQLDSDQLTCEFSVTRLEGNSGSDTRLGRARININGTVIVSKSITLGSNVNSSFEYVRQTLTEGVPVIGNAIFEGVPSTVRTIDLLKLHLSKGLGSYFSVDYFDLTVVNNN